MMTNPRELFLLSKFNSNKKFNIDFECWDKSIDRTKLKALSIVAEFFSLEKLQTNRFQPETAY